MAMSAVHRITFTALARVALLSLIFGAAIGMIWGSTSGGIAGAFTVFLCFWYYAWKLAQLSEWLNDPKAATLPDGFGVWGETLGNLYRLIRLERTAQQALATTLDRFQEAASALPDGAVMLDNQYNIVWCNPNAEAHWSISLGRDRMQTITYLIRYPEFIDYLNARKFGQPLTLKISQPKTSSSATDVTLSVQLVSFGDEQMLLLSRDISEREQLETMRRDFVANVSHELRTPLTVLLGFLETISAAGNSNPVVIEKSLAHMGSQTLRMERLVNDLLALSRLEDNRNRLTAAPINMPELIAGIALDAKHLSQGHHKIVLESDTGWLIGNRDEISSALSNLVTNAVRYTPAGGQISLRWSTQNGASMFSVSDNGEGIPAEHLPRLTERFYRVDRGRSRASGGTGLGLAIVKHVLLRHGAQLEITSSQHVETHGTEFRIVFPVERTCPPQPSLQIHAASATA